MCITNFLAQWCGLVLKLFLLSDRPWWKHAIEHFWSFYTNIFEKSIKVFVPILETQKLRWCNKVVILSLISWNRFDDIMHKACALINKLSKIFLQTILPSDRNFYDLMLPYFEWNCCRQYVKKPSYKFLFV